MKPSGKSQTNRNTFKNIILGSNLEITYFFQWVIRITLFQKVGGKKSFRFYILNRASLIVIKQEDFE